MNSLSGWRIVARLTLGLIVAVGCASFLGVPWPQWRSTPDPVWRELKVRVSEADGTAAREVVVILEVPSLNGSSEIARAKTDPNGRVRMNVQVPLPSELRLVVDLPLERPPQLAQLHVAEALAFAREIEIPLPDAGSLHIDLEDERGVAMREPVRVQLHWREVGDQGSTLERLRGWTQTAHGGRIQFPLVALRRAWRITAEQINGQAAFSSWEGDGPREAGEITNLTLRRSPPWPVFRGIAVDEADQPLRHAVLLAAEDSGDPEAQRADGAWTRIACDAQGAFVFSLRTETRELPHLRLRTLDEPRREARVPVRRSEVASEGTDLGVVRLAALPLLIAGRVSMADATIATGAWIEVLACEPHQEEREAEVLIPAQRCVDEQGRFALHLRHPARHLLVRSGTHQHVLAQFRGVPAGTVDLQLRLAASTTLRGRLKLDPKIRASALRARIGDDAGHSYEVAVEEDGSFAFDGVPQGQWLVEVHGTSGRIGTTESWAWSKDAAPLHFDLTNSIRSLSYTWTTHARQTPRAALLRDAYGTAVQVELHPNQAHHWLVRADRGPYSLVIDGAPPIDLEAK